MTVTRVPEPEVPITDPRWLASTQPDPTPEIDGGLDGRGTTHAADLPASAHVWGHLAAPVDYNDDLEAEAPVRREKCLLVDPDGDYLMPGRCKKPLGHEPPHDWGATHGAFLGEVRRAELTQGGSPPPSGFTQREMEDFSGYVAYAASAELDTPLGRLPVRTPGAALEEEREVVETWTA